ncbi:MAG: hypothetical protein ACRDZP_07255 [Acidimicrobiales bacterium]
MSESELHSGDDEVVETEEGFAPAKAEDVALIDSEIDFDDEEYQDEELIGEKEAGNAEDGVNAHLDDPDLVGDDETF